MKSIPPDGCRTSALHSGPSKKIQSLLGEIKDSYAHNSLAYKTFEQDSSLEGLVEFLIWDSAQPPFYQYLQNWVTLVPPYIRKALEEHIEVEVTEEHSRLFNEMLNELLRRAPMARVQVDPDQLRILNYTFSEECAVRENFGFFLGGFLATELMSAKRCQQLLNGLLRLELPLSHLKYLEIHCEADQKHAVEVIDLLIQPVLEADPSQFSNIQQGLRDRLSRSSQYLKWYEMVHLTKNQNPKITSLGDRHALGS